MDVRKTLKKFMEKREVNRIVIYCPSKKEKENFLKLFKENDISVYNNSDAHCFLFCDECECLGWDTFNYFKRWGYLIVKFSEIFPPEQPVKSIHITQKGDTVVSVYKEGDEVIDRTVAKCHPDDEFDFGSGARIAFNRLGVNREFAESCAIKPKEKVFVFDKFKFIEDVGVKAYKRGSSWVDKAHGKTAEEMKEMNLCTDDAWMVSQYVD